MFMYEVVTKLLGTICIFFYPQSFSSVKVSVISCQLKFFYITSKFYPKFIVFDQGSLGVNILTKMKPAENSSEWILKQIFKCICNCFCRISNKNIRFVGFT